MNYHHLVCHNHSYFWYLGITTTTTFTPNTQPSSSPINSTKQSSETSKNSPKPSSSSDDQGKGENKTSTTSPGVDPNDNPKSNENNHFVDSKSERQKSSRSSEALCKDRNVCSGLPPKHLLCFLPNVNEACPKTCGLC